MIINSFYSSFKCFRHWSIYYTHSFASHAHTHISQSHVQSDYDFIFMILFDNPFIHWLMILVRVVLVLFIVRFIRLLNRMPVWAFTIIMDLSYSHGIFSTNKTAANKIIVLSLLWLLIALSLFRWHLFLWIFVFLRTNDARQQTHKKEEAGK